MSDRRRLLAEAEERVQQAEFEANKKRAENEGTEVPTLKPSKKAKVLRDMGVTMRETAERMNEAIMLDEAAEADLSTAVDRSDPIDEDEEQDDDEEDDAL